MGHLHYGQSDASYEFDDRTLAHLEIVTLAKLRRNESFALSIEGDDGSRSTAWLSPASTLRFEYAVGRHEINREWLELLIDLANSTSGLRVVPEPAAP